MSLSARSPAVLTLSETLGISKQRCITLLAASSGDVERAVDIYYTQQTEQQWNSKQYEQMPELESPHTLSLPPHHSATAATTEVHPAASSSTIPSHPPSARPNRQSTAPTASSFSTPLPLPASRVKSELAHRAASPSSLSSSTPSIVAATKSKPSLFAPSASSHAAVKREPAAAPTQPARPKAPSLFSASASTQPKAEASPSSPATTAPTSHSPSASSSSSTAAAPPRVDRVSVRIIDTINPDTPAITMRFPLDTTLHRVYAELERRGFPGVKLYHAKSQLSPELTPRELCLVDKCVLEMEYEQQPHTALLEAAVGEKRMSELKEAEPAAKRRRVESSRAGKEEKQAVAEEGGDDNLESEYKEAPPLDGRANSPVPASFSASSVVEAKSLHVERPVTFSRLRLALVPLRVRARVKSIAKRSHNFSDLYTSLHTVGSNMTVASAQDEMLLTLINEINSGQRHPIGVEVKWQRVQAAQPAEDSEDDSIATSDYSPVLTAAMALLRAALGQSDQPKQVAHYKWLHTFDVELYLLPVCIGWSITHMSELLELLWGDKWRQLMSRVWSERYQPGDGKPTPPMDQSSLLRMAQRFDYHATLDDSVLSPHAAPTVSSKFSSDSSPTTSSFSSSAFPFRTPPPYESSESVGLRYLVQRERQKAVSSWLSESELEPHQLSLESCIGLSLRDYQQQSVLWMLGQELRDSVSERFWIECRVDGQPLLYSPLFQQWRMGPLECQRGGLLSDTMGLGKTIVTLALINLRPAPDEFCISSQPASYVASPAHPVRSRATLIIAPVSLVPQWEAELRQHSLRPLRVYCFYGSNRETDPRVLAQYDVVLTTYGVLSSDTSGQRFRRRKGAPSMFHCIEWWRVVIDEGHLLRDTSRKQSNAAAAILSQQRHILTGTPISSSVTELRGLFSFLQCAVLADSPSFWSHLQAASRSTPTTAPPTPAEERSYRHMTFPPHAVYAVAEEIFCRLCMRHTKDQPFNGRSTLAPLPARTDVVHKVDFTPTQRAAYDELYAIARRKWDDIVRRGVESSSIIAAFSYLLPLRQACAGTIIDMAEVRRREAESAQRLQAAERAEESRQAHARMLLPALPVEADDNDDEADEVGSTRQFPYANTLPYNQLEDECVVCLSEFNQPLQTKCGHLFCADCILSVIDMESPEPTCPQCRARVTKSTLRRPRPRPKTPPPPPSPSFNEESALSSSSAAPPPASSSSSPSLLVDNVVFDSKLEVVVSHILQLQRSDPATKALVFSQFASTLSYLSSRLTSLHVTVYRITGDMTMTTRRRVLHSFNSTTSFSVFLLTPRVGAVGLTLTSASHCYIIEPALNWTLTEQAVGRVHRLGQQRPVTCVHYVMRGSVEERIRAVTGEKVAGRRDGEAAGDSDSSGEAGAASRAPTESAGIGSDAMIGLNTMGSMKKDAAVYRVQELERLFER